MRSLRQLIREIHRRSLWQVLGIYLVGSWAVLQVVDTLGGALNLPSWFPSFALALLIVGLPIVLATAFVQEGGPGHDGQPAEAPAPRPSSAVGLFTWRNAFGGGVLAFALWGVVAAAWLAFGGGAPNTAATVADATGGVTRRLVVLPLDNLTDDPELDVLGRLAADEMARAIDRRQPVAVVPSRTVAEAIETLGGTPSVQAVAEAVQATHAFAGTVSRIGGQIRFQVELIDPATSERLRSVDALTGPVERTDSLVAELAGRAAAEAVVVFNPAAPPWVGDMSSPVSAAAYEAFLEQTAIFCTGDNEGSIPPGERAVRESPRFVAAIYQLQQAHGNLAGDPGHAAARDSLIEILEGLRGEMTRNEELSLDWTLANRDGDGARAERAAEEAYRLDPVGRSGAAMMSKWRVGKMSESIERLADLELPGACPWPGYYAQGSIPYHALGRFQEELDLIRGGLEVYPELPQFLDIEARALVGLGRMEAVDSVLQVVDDLPSDNGRFRVSLDVMAELRAHGFEAEGDRLTETMLGALPPNPTAVDDRQRRAVTLMYARRWAEALPLFESIAKDRADDVGFLDDYGVTLARVGRREDALAVSHRVDELASGATRYRVGGKIAAALGDGDEAVRLLGLAFENGFTHVPDIHREPAFDLVWSYGPFATLMRPR